VKLKKIAGTATVVGALGAAALGIGVGTAQADGWEPWVPWVPHVDDWNRGLNWGAPGQLKKACPWLPPGHWAWGPHGMPCIPG
jgi:hypothetical protein